MPPISMAATQGALHNVSCFTMSVGASVKQTKRSMVNPRKLYFTPLRQSRFSLKAGQHATILRTHNSKRPITAMAESSLVKKVNAQELDTILDSGRDRPIVIDFYATWCGPCVLLSKELEQLALEYGETVKFLKVDTDEESELANEMKIQGLPTLIFVSNDLSKNAIRTEGLLPADVIRNIIETEL